VRLSLKAINSELERLGSNAVLAKGDGYFYFWGGEAADWLDRTVRVPTLQSLTLEQWIGQFRVLREKNHDLLTGKLGARPGDRRDQDLKARKPSGQNKRAGRRVQGEVSKKRSPR
jgi:hypothetical protein